MSNRIISKVICLKKSRFEFVVEGQLTFYFLKVKNFTLFLNDYNWTNHQSPIVERMARAIATFIPVYKLRNPSVLAIRFNASKQFW
jgi:hypothetical protein